MGIRDAFLPVVRQPFAGYVLAAPAPLLPVADCISAGRGICASYR
jgi:hypothetical protein